MINESFEEMFNADFSLQNEDPHQIREGSEIGMDETSGNYSDKELMMIADSGGISCKNQEDLVTAAESMQNELLSRKIIPPPRISDIESKLSDK